ncbi:MAG: hypothetical protein Q4E36_04810 [Bacillota bacterium]|nr:hypothetical protein [Bacillota bacterium]
MDSSIRYLREDIVDNKRYNEIKTTTIEMYTPTEYRYLRDQMIKSKDWEIEILERILDLMVDGYRKNEGEIRKLNIYLDLYYMSLHTDYNGGYKYATEVFKNEIEDYLDLKELPFDLYALEDLHQVSWSHINRAKSVEDIESIHSAYQVNKKDLERKFFLLKNNLKEVDETTTSPWTYLANSYSYLTIKPKLFLPLFIILSTYTLIYARREKSLDLIKLRPGKRYKIYGHYVKIILSLSLIILVGPDLLAVLFMGIKNGFFGLANPIGIYRDGLKTLYPYENIGIVARIRGLGIVFGVGFYSWTGDAMEFLALENIEFYKFLLLASIPSILKVIFFVVLGVSIGLLIKNEVLGLLTSSIVSLFTILSAILALLKTSYNIFSLDSGWNITLGHTNFSWLGSVLGLSLGICLVVALSLLVLRNRELD